MIILCPVAHSEGLPSFIDKVFTQWCNSLFIVGRVCDVVLWNATHAIFYCISKEVTFHVNIIKIIDWVPVYL